MKRYVPHVDEDACLAHGDCAVAAPGVFQIEEIAEVVGEGDADAILKSAEACPAGAIIVVDADTNEQIYP